ncbi:unnamed protein product [Caenorhabditis angaria]|uniref:Uncharacterized protein n=1 Tax=Caenorhabditis angaria TaxID=860376 RepID=A0A9P1I452_9PELO|nr:unnamed protein product [Caenorhabditis angaria]
MEDDLYDIALEESQEAETSSEKLENPEESDKMHKYAIYVRKLIIGARKNIEKLENENRELRENLKNALNSAGVVTCPDCTHSFKDRHHLIRPNHMKAYRANKCVELEFKTTEEMTTWLFLNQLETNSDGMPTVMKNEKVEQKFSTLKSVGSKIPEIREKIRIAIGKSEKSGNSAENRAGTSGSSRNFENREASRKLDEKSEIRAENSRKHPEVSRSSGNSKLKSENASSSRITEKSGNPQKPEFSRTSGASRRSQEPAEQKPRFTGGSENQDEKSETSRTTSRKTQESEAQKSSRKLAENRRSHTESRSENPRKSEISRSSEASRRSQDPKSYTENSQKPRGAGGSENPRMSTSTSRKSENPHKPEHSKSSEASRRSEQSQNSLEKSRSLAEVSQKSRSSENSAETSQKTRSSGSSEISRSTSRTAESVQKPRFSTSSEASRRSQEPQKSAESSRNPITFTEKPSILSRISKKPTAVRKLDIFEENNILDDKKSMKNEPVKLEEFVKISGGNATGYKTDFKIPTRKRKGEEPSKKLEIDAETAGKSTKNAPITTKKFTITREKKKENSIAETGESPEIPAKIRKIEEKPEKSPKSSGTQDLPEFSQKIDNSYVLPTSTGNLAEIRAVSQKSSENPQKIDNSYVLPISSRNLAQNAPNSSLAENLQKIDNSYFLPSSAENLGLSESALKFLKNRAAKLQKEEPLESPNNLLSEFFPNFLAAKNEKEKIEEVEEEAEEEDMSYWMSGDNVEESGEENEEEEEEEFVCPEEYPESNRSSANSSIISSSSTSSKNSKIEEYSDCSISQDAIPITPKLLSEKKEEEIEELDWDFDDGELVENNSGTENENEIEEEEIVEETDQIPITPNNNPIITPQDLEELDESGEIYEEDEEPKKEPRCSKSPQQENNRKSRNNRENSNKNRGKRRNEHLVESYSMGICSEPKKIIWWKTKLTN